MKTRGRLFISYSSHDKPFANNIMHWLEAYGFDDIWYDNRSLGGDKPKENIGSAIALAQVFVVLLSPEALESDLVNSAIDDVLALSRKGAQLKIIPIVVKPCSIPLMLNGYKCLDITSGKDPVTELTQLVEMIEGQEPSGVLPEMPKQTALEAASQKPQKQWSSKFSINMDDVHANIIKNYQADNISITEDDGTGPASRFGARKDGGKK